MVPKEYVTWEDVHQFVEKAIQYCESLRSSGKQFTGIYGIPRGGLIFAVLLSYALNIPMLMSPAPGCVIIDDICDSGESLVHYVNNTSGGKRLDYTIITMYYKENVLCVIPDYYVREKGNKWIVFPWEERR